MNVAPAVNNRTDHNCDLCNQPLHYQCLECEMEMYQVRSIEVEPTRRIWIGSGEDMPMMVC